MATFSERATNVLFLLYIFVILVVSHFGLEDETLVLIMPVPCDCLSFSFHVLKLFFRLLQYLFYYWFFYQQMR